MKLSLLIMCILLTSCIAEEKRTNSIKLSSYSAQILAGGKCVIYIYSEVKAFGLQSENPKIATAEYLNDSKAILITGTGVGNTSIYLKDRRNPDNFAEIKVTSDYLSGKFKEDGDSVNIWVSAIDRDVQRIIENELNDIAQQWSGVIFNFDKNTKVVEIDYSSAAHNNNKKTGTYEWEKDCLTLNFNDSISQYGFAIVNDRAIILKLDFLEIYKSKYPDASVIAARIGYFLSPIE